MKRSVFATSRTTDWISSDAKPYSMALSFRGTMTVHPIPSKRINLLGWLNGIVVHMTYTERGDEPHIISLRRAEKHEIRRYAKEITR